MLAFTQWCHARGAAWPGSAAGGRGTGGPGRPAGQDGSMAALKDRLRGDLTAAMKARDVVRTRTLRMALTSLAQEEVAGASARELSDADVIKVLTREAKRRREAAEAFAAAGRDEQAAAERAEGAVLDAYLPAQLSDEELAAMVAAVIDETGASGMAAMGQVMRVLTPRVAGRADGARVAAEVRRRLAGSRPDHPRPDRPEAVARAASSSSVCGGQVPVAKIPDA